MKKIFLFSLLKKCLLEIRNNSLRGEDKRKDAILKEIDLLIYRNILLKFWLLQTIRECFDGEHTI